jgi:hypothetical protein
MTLKKGGIQVVTNTKQEGLYKGNSNTLLRGIYVEFSFTIDKALGRSLVYFRKCSL